MAALDYSVFGRVDDANNKPVNGGYLRIYTANTTSLASVFSNAALSTPLTNPVVTDSAGRLPPVFIGPGTYDLALLDAEGGLIDDFDDYTVPDLDGLDDVTFPLESKTADYSLAAGDSGKVLEVNADAAPGTLITITAEAGDRGNGFLISIVNIGSTGKVLISPDIGETIDGTSSLYLNPGQGVIMVSRGASGWRTISRKNRSVSQPQGRLTLVTATPYMTSDQTGKSSIFYTPYVGKYVPIWDGFEWITTPFSELTLALDNDSGHTGYHQTDKNFDLFVVNDAGTVRLGTGPAWTSDTARGTGAGTTELAITNGLLVNANTMTLRFGSGSGNTVSVAAAKATYVGSFRTTANGQTAWVATPAAAAGGGACTLYLWNMYNRRAVAAYSRDSTDTWTYTTATIRAANAGGTGSGLNNRVSILRGLDEGVVQARYSVSTTNSTVATLRRAFIGLDSVTAFAAGSSPGDAMADNMTASAVFSSPAVGLGLHYVQALEWSAAAGSCTWYGDNGTTTLVQMILSLQTEM